MLGVIPRLKLSLLGNTTAANNTLGPNLKCWVASYEDQKGNMGELKKVFIEVWFIQQNSLLLSVYSDF